MSPSEPSLIQPHKTPIAKSKRVALAKRIYEKTECCMDDFLGGPKFIKQAWAVNIQKIITLFLIFGMMIYFDNFSTQAWIYLGLHGIYGYCWLIKDLNFRDQNLEKKVTLGGAIMYYPLLIGWYWLIPYFFISRHVDPGNVMLFVAVAIHTLGITLMIGADCQKYFTLKYRKGLITEGLFTFTRNPNYLGEILIYSAYVLLAHHYVAWIIFGYACLIFYMRMLIKDASISRYPEWDSYIKHSSLLFPWKLLSGSAYRK